MDSYIVAARAHLQRSTPWLRSVLVALLGLIAIMAAFGGVAACVIAWQKPAQLTDNRPLVFAAGVAALLVALATGWSALQFGRRSAWLIGTAVLLLLGIAAAAYPSNEKGASAFLPLILGVCRFLWGVEPATDEDDAAAEDHRDNEPRIRA